MRRVTCNDIAALQQTNTLKLFVCNRRKVVLNRSLQLRQQILLMTKLTLSTKCNTNSQTEELMEFDNNTLENKKFNWENEELWEKCMRYKYGSGSYALFRPLYKDLCDERRREFSTKPPLPFSEQRHFWEQFKNQKYMKKTSFRKKDNKDNETSHIESSKNHFQSAKVEDADSTTVHDISKPSNNYYQQSNVWNVEYNKENNYVIFKRDAVDTIKQTRAIAFGKIGIGNYIGCNPSLPFQNICYIEVFIERNNVILHYSLAYYGHQMKIRNVRVYDKANNEKISNKTNAVDNKLINELCEPQICTNNKEEKKEECFIVNGIDLMSCTINTEWIRTNLFYDGPFWLHLEFAVQEELEDVMADHGITMKWAAWVENWIYYLEHIQYLRWSVGLLDALIPQEIREDKEDDFLSPVEQQLLTEPYEEFEYYINP